MPAPMPMSPPVLGKPIMQQPQPPQTGGIPVTGGGPLGSGILPIANLPTGPVSPPTNIRRLMANAPGVISAVPQEPIQLKGTQLPSGTSSDLGGVGPTTGPFVGGGPKPIFTTDEPIDPANLRVSGPVPMPSLADLSMPKITTPNGPPLAQVTLGSGITPEGQDPFQKMPLPPKRDDFMSIGGPGGALGLDERDAIDSGVPVIPPTPSPVPEPVTTPTPVTTSAPVTPAEIVSPPASTTVANNQPTETTAPVNVSNQDPFASSVRQVASGLDPLTEQLLFGIGGQGGFIPGAMRAAERTFYDEEGNPIVIDEQVAGFSPDQIAAIEMQRQSLGLQDPYIQDARSALQASMQAYDPSITGQFFNPFEDRVVQQTIQDVMEQGAKSDIGALAGDIARGGQSAFGSRARLGAAERQEALGRGLSEALGSLRARGFSEAQRAGMGEFARQAAAQRAGASGLASLGAQAAGASLSDIGALYGMGTQQQTQAQAMLDAQRRNLQQRQMTPLLQYQALQPFVSMAPAGQFQTITDFAPRPSAMMTGIGTGLQAFGSLGKLYGGS
jgi:hypothetical protein